MENETSDVINPEDTVAVPTGRPFIRRNLLRIVAWFFYVTLFIVMGIMGVGYAAVKYGQLSNAEVLVTFGVTGWAFFWRAFTGVSTIVGIVVFIKWVWFRQEWKIAIWLVVCMWMVFVLEGSEMFGGDTGSAVLWTMLTVSGLVGIVAQGKWLLFL